uniref:Uncharacterized protein n=1 Tax=Cucumis melo TaxID=3656 RepID=A0A9I9E6R1_CUCME
MKQIGKGKKEKDQNNGDCFIVDHLGTHKLVCEVHLQDMAFRYLVVDLWNAILDGCAIDCNDEFRKLAVKFNLPNKDIKESQGICFLKRVLWDVRLMALSKFNVQCLSISNMLALLFYKTCQLVLKFSDGYTFPEQVFYFLILPDSQRQVQRRFQLFCLRLMQRSTSNAEVRSTSDAILHVLSSSYGYPKVRNLVLENADYVIDSICRQLHHLDLNPHVPNFLAAILSYIGIAHEILPLLEEPAS